MLHTKIVDSKKDKILSSNAEKFIRDSKFGASIYFLGTVRNINDNKIFFITFILLFFVWKETNSIY